MRWEISGHKAIVLSCTALRICSKLLRSTSNVSFETTYSTDPTNGRAKAGRPARTCIQQLCEDTDCSPEDLPEAMDDREKWQERVKDIHAGGTT